MFPYPRAVASREGTMAHAYRDILFDAPEPGIARVTLNRPSHLNAYTGRMCTDLVVVFEEYVARDDLRCLIVTGAGRGFCSGGHVSGEAWRHIGQVRAAAGRRRRLVLSARHGPRPCPKDDSAERAPFRG